jgi:hypothetical protein
MGIIGSHVNVTSKRRGHQGRRTVSIRRAQQRLVKTEGALIKHARYWLLLAESRLARHLFAAMV